MNWECIYCDKNNFSDSSETLPIKNKIICRYCNLTNFHNCYNYTDTDKIKRHLSRYKKINIIVDSIPYSLEKYPSNYITRELLLQCCIIDSAYVIPQVTEHIILQHIKYRLYVQRKLKWNTYRRNLCKKKYLKLLKLKILNQLNIDVMECILDFL